MNYIMVEVVESAWNEFLAEATAANDLDELNKIHSGFITKILDRALLNLVTDQLYRQLLRLLELILRFRFIQETLDMSANEEYERRKQIRELRVLQQMGSGLNSSDEDEGDYQPRFPVEATTQLDTVAMEYNEALNKFRHLLNETGKGHLRFLAFRLDFNEYYQMKED